MNFDQNAEKLEGSTTSEINFELNQIESVGQEQSKVNACQMEIANSKQQADPVDKKATDDLEDTEMPSSPCKFDLIFTVIMWATH